MGSIDLLLDNIVDASTHNIVCTKSLQVANTPVEELVGVRFFGGLFPCFGNENFTIDAIKDQHQRQTCSE